MARLTLRQWAERLFEAMAPVEGEWRTVYRCIECRLLYGRRYIPGGLGQGLTIAPCLCQLVSSQSRAEEIETRKP